MSARNISTPHCDMATSVSGIHKVIHAAISQCKKACVCVLLLVYMYMIVSLRTGTVVVLSAILLQGFFFVVFS